MINSIDIVGNVRIKDLLRLKYFLSVLTSFSFLKNNCSFFINIENGQVLVKPIERYLKRTGYINVYICAKKDYYGKVYTNLLEKTESEYILNLEDDHFCVLNDKEIFFQMLDKAFNNKVDIIPVTFFHLLKQRYFAAKVFVADEQCKIYEFNANMFRSIGFTQESYIVGNNCIFQRDYAFEHWEKKIETFRPHPFEEVGFDEDYRKILLMPEFEILRPIDDDHGIDNSCCLKNPDHDKWEAVFNNITFDRFPMKKIKRFCFENKKPNLFIRGINKAKRILKHTFNYY